MTPMNMTKVYKERAGLGNRKKLLLTNVLTGDRRALQVTSIGLQEATVPVVTAACSFVNLFRHPTRRSNMSRKLSSDQRPGSTRSTSPSSRSSSVMAGTGATSGRR
jgi:hypothetical protein